MKLVSILIFKWNSENPILLSSHMDLSFANFFMRNAVKEHIIFHSRLICSRTGINMRQTIQFEQNLGNCHSYVHPSGLACTVLTDAEYSQRVVYSLINQVLRSFHQMHHEALSSITEDTELPFPEGDTFLQSYQNPTEADKLLKVQKDLDEVRGVMLKNMDELLQRGEKLDDLMMKTSDLSKTSLQFYRSAKKQNQCCRLY